MEWQRLREWLQPAAAEQDAGFRKEIGRLGMQGLRLIGLLTIVVPIFMFVVQQLIGQDPRAWNLALFQTLAIIAVWISASAAGRTKWAERCPRLLAAGSGWMTVTILIWTTLRMSEIRPEVVHYITAHITTVMLVATAALPMRPLQTPREAQRSLSIRPLTGPLSIHR